MCLRCFDEETAIAHIEIFRLVPPSTTRATASTGSGKLIQVPLTTPASEDGTHLYDSLAVLFRLVDEGYDPQIREDDEGLHESLVFRSLRADLFRAESTSHINEVKLQRETSTGPSAPAAEQGGQGRDRGFISYAERIYQLGAVYEGLMSYTGRFAESDLYEVAKGGDSSKGSWLVPVDRAGGIDDKDFVRIEYPSPASVSRCCIRRVRSSSAWPAANGSSLPPTTHPRY